MKKSIITLAVLVVIFAALFAVINVNKKNGVMAPVSTDPYHGTLSGIQTCLPHKNTDGPQTLECAFGLKTDAGDYYALDFSMMSEPNPDIQSGKRFTANGLITPIENLSSDHWKIYNVKGIFSVTDGVVVDAQPVQIGTSTPKK